jgi:hypothetical protein
MNHSFELLKSKIPGFNRRRQTESDFWKLIKREGIVFVTFKLPPGGKAFYGVNRVGRRVYRFIVMDEDLFKSADWLETAFHELIHHFLHPPMRKQVVYWSRTDRHTKDDRQADMFALLMRIPLPVFLELSEMPFDQITEFTKHELIQRKRFYETYGY